MRLAGRIFVFNAICYNRNARCCGGVVTQRSAKPRTPVQFRSAPPSLARVAELVYAFDLKSNEETHMGSSPISGTKKQPPKRLFFYQTSNS